VYDAANRYAARQLKAAWLPAIVAETGLGVLQAIAQQCGAVVVALPVATNDAHADLVNHAATVMRETADVLTAVSASLADGRLTDSERQQIDQQIVEAHAALASLSLVVAQTKAA
jgi:uncharacterized membrane protein YebE (DUF533 family)